MKNNECVIGLFQGMFNKTILTFNPGWNINAEEINPLEDVRASQERFRENGIEFVEEVDLLTNGPGNFFIVDPDGNPLLFDQYR